jgi:hypothetical protein
VLAQNEIFCCERRAEPQAEPEAIEGVEGSVNGLITRRVRWRNWHEHFSLVVLTLE